MDAQLKNEAIRAQMVGHWSQRKPSIKMQIALNTIPTHRLVLNLLLVAALQLTGVIGSQQTEPSFPGVTRDLASFCSSRPSLSIDLAPMIVHVKRNTSFNYKLYLFSQDEHIFQTGQIVPRDDFRIHSFPVKLKHLDEFMQMGTNKDREANQSSAGLKVYQLVRDEGGARDATRRGRSRLVRVPSSSFDSRRFFARVQLVQDEEPHEPETSGGGGGGGKPEASKHQARALPFDVQGDALPGDDSHHANHHNQHDAALASNSNANEHIEFDRDDQLAILGQPASRLRELNRRHSPRASTPPEQQAGAHLRHHQAMFMPVGSFSAFRVNMTYLARKDFNQLEAELIRLQVDARNFQVERVDLLRPVLDQQAGADHEADNSTTTTSDTGELPSDDDFAFLSHRLLRDRNVRLTSISQIYEDWITRNHYTIVYIQRRLNEPTGLVPDADELEREELQTAERHKKRLPKRGATRETPQEVLVSERLVFRGSSIVLLGADQLDYHVKASAFITEKNGLHYFLEFLPNGRFYLGAIDWSKRPFKFMDSQRFPIKPTQTQFDNEELLLCPPSVCYSEQPIDELVAYGRLPLPPRLQHEATILSKSSSASAASSLHSAAPVMPTESVGPMRLSAGQQYGNTSGETTTTSHQSESISLDNLIEAVRAAAAARLDLRLHLRDWTWQLSREQPNNRRPAYDSARLVWHYERARRNELKAVPDTYGFALVGHEIDASYRVFNELYLISASNLIGIDYTLANETATSVRPIGDEFPGLSSNLLDPITGAFYDRYSNQIYFFKGDRYVGYDYATKKPLEDFLLPPALDDTLGGLNLALLMQPASSQSSRDSNNNKRAALVSSLPVAEILGRQHQVDAIYHDLGEDLVYVFTRMKFYTLKASDFKDGAFRHNAASSKAAAMQCINEHFLAGCRFDAAYPNPCQSDQAKPDEPQRPAQPHVSNPTDERPMSDGKQLEVKPKEGNNFSEEQQMKLRSIAARGGATVGLMDFLLENTLVAQGAGREPAARLRTGDTEQIVIYLLVAMVLVTVLVTVAMIVVVLNWARVKAPHEFHDKSPAGQRNKMAAAEDERRGGGGAPQRLTERLAYPPAIAHYLSSQYQQQAQRPPSLAGYFYNGPPPPSASATGARRLGHYGASAGPLTAPPTLPPPPAPRRSAELLVDSSMF